MKTNDGDSSLVPRDEWVDEKEIQGLDGYVTKHPVIEKAFEGILNDFKPEHDVCLLSACTVTRPYSKSVKWKKYIEAFQSKADLIVVSTAGIIPQKYWTCYPYMTYDTYGNAKTRGIVYKTMADRMSRFFEKNQYKRIVVVAKPQSALRIVALKLMEQHENVELVPTAWERELDRDNRFKPYGGHYPELAEHCFAHIERAVNI